MSVIFSIYFVSVGILWNLCLQKILNLPQLTCFRRRIDPNFFLKGLKEIFLTWKHLISVKHNNPHCYKRLNSFVILILIVLMVLKPQKCAVGGSQFGDGASHFCHFLRRGVYLIPESTTQDAL